MRQKLDSLIVPKAGEDPHGPPTLKPIGFGLAVVGLAAVAVAAIAAISAANSSTETGSTFAWAFGLAILGFAIIKLAIGVVLVGILRKIRHRADAVLAACTRLRPEHREAPEPRGTVDTEFGRATETRRAPGPLAIHRMARAMWAPMIAMGAMAVAAGFILSLVWAGGVADGTQQAAQAWTQGVLFLGEGLLLAGISFLLGTVLAALREGGGRLQEELGIPVRVLVMPPTAKAFVGLMVLGLMVSIAQVVLYAVAAGISDPQSFAAWAAWLGPLREVGLGLLLAGIVLALVTIGNVLAFQFARVREILTTGA